MNQSSIAIDTDTNTLRYDLLHGKYPVLRELVECVRLQLGDSYWHLDPNETYTARQLLGAPFMALLSTRERMLVGSVLAHFAYDRAVPLVKVSAKGCYPNKYELVE